MVYSKKNLKTQNNLNIFLELYSYSKKNLKRNFKRHKSDGLACFLE